MPRDHHPCVQRNTRYGTTMVGVVGYCYTLAVRFESERSRDKRRWSFETTGAIDRAVAGLLIVLAMLLAQLIGLPADLLRVVGLL